MKTTLEIPDAIFRRAKAAEHNIPLRTFVSEAVAEKLEMKSPAREKTQDGLGGKAAPLAPRNGPNQHLD
ncbi:MAG: hypothetical protein ABSA59_20955 [Terriglobia bacterium]|jgi:hypothetical protein